MKSSDHDQQRGWSPVPNTFSFQSSGTKHIEAINQISYLSVAFKPVRKSSFTLETQGVNAGAITQWYTKAPFGFVSSPKFSIDKITIRFVTNGAIVRRNYSSAYLGVPGRAMFVAFEEMVTEEASSEFCAFTGTVDRSALISHHRALEGSDERPFPQFEPVVDILSGPMRAFRHNFQLIYARLQAGTEEGDFTFNLLQEMVIYQFLTAWPKKAPQSDDVTAFRPSWQVRRAIDYIEANLQRKVTLAEIAAVAHLGVRSLQLGFRKELGKTPVQWILERRLAKVHKDLKSATEGDAAVSVIARRWGFAHMSDFSRRYKMQYGETPQQSKTRRH